MKNANQPPQIVKQQLALDSYLSTLLESVPEAELPVETIEVAPAVVVEVESLPLKSMAKSRLEPPAPVVETDAVVDDNPATLHPLSVMPDWTRDEFQALFFKIEHLTLAAPLTELSRTIKIDRRIGQIPGQPSWFMGLLDDQDSRVGVLDTGQLIFGKLRGSQRDLVANPFQRILITEDKRWGLACDEILSIGKLQPEKIRWRTSRQKRPWLIGTVIDELTVILDIQALVPHRRHS